MNLYLEMLACFNRAGFVEWSDQIHNMDYCDDETNKHVLFTKYQN